MSDPAQDLSREPDIKEKKVRKAVLPGQTPKGEHVLSVLVKRTYDLLPEGRCVRAKEDWKLFSADVHYDSPMNSSVKFESDHIPYKTKTDVVVNGVAWAPRGQSAQVLNVSVAVGSHRKNILVIGDRVCRFRRFRTPVFSDPNPFNHMEIRYERAYGGVDIYSDSRVRYFYPRNPLGQGFVVAYTKKTVENLPLPNIEDPGHLIQPETVCLKEYKNWENLPEPQGFGWVSKFCQPRAAYGGVLPADRELEQELRAAYAKAVPSDQREKYETNTLPAMDFRFFNGASKGLSLPFLEGDEPVQLNHLDPDGEIGFELPGERPFIGIDIGMGVQSPSVVLHTVMIRMAERQVDMVWRGAVSYPGPEWLPEMQKMDVTIE